MAVEPMSSESHLQQKQFIEHNWFSMEELRQIMFYNNDIHRYTVLDFLSKHAVGHVMISRQQLSSTRIPETGLGRCNCSDTFSDHLENHMVFDDVRLVDEQW